MTKQEFIDTLASLDDHSFCELLANELDEFNQISDDIRSYWRGDPSALWFIEYRLYKHKELIIKCPDHIHQLHESVKRVLEHLLRNSK